MASERHKISKLMGLEAMKRINLPSDFTNILKMRPFITLDYLLKCALTATLVAIACCPLTAQDALENIELDTNQIRKIRLKPLNVLIDLAVQNAPALRANAIEIAKYNTAYKIQKLAWTDALQLTVGSIYGKGALLDATNNGAGTSYLLSDRQNLSNTIGMNLRLSSGMFTLTSYRNNLAKLQVERYNVERDIQIKTIREDVISLYVQLESTLRMMRLKAETLSSQRLSMSVAEKYFREGNLSVMDYNTIVGQVSTAEENFEKVRSDSKRLYLLLHEFVGAPIQLKTKN